MKNLFCSLQRLGFGAKVGVGLLGLFIGAEVHAAPLYLWFYNQTTNAPLFDVSVRDVYENTKVTSLESTFVYSSVMPSVTFSFHPAYGAMYILEIDPAFPSTNPTGSYTVVFESSNGQECDFSADINADTILMGGGPANPIPVKKKNCKSTNTKIAGTWPMDNPPAPLPPGAKPAPKGSVGGTKYFDPSSPKSASAALGTVTKKDAISDILAQIGVNPTDLCIPNPTCGTGETCFPDSLYFSSDTSIPSDTGNITVASKLDEKTVTKEDGTSATVQSYLLVYKDMRYPENATTPLPTPNIQVKAGTCSCQ